MVLPTARSRKAPQARRGNSILSEKSCALPHVSNGKAPRMVTTPVQVKAPYLRLRERTPNVYPAHIIAANRVRPVPIHSAPLNFVADALQPTSVRTPPAATSKPTRTDQRGRSRSTTIEKRAIQIGSVAMIIPALPAGIQRMPYVTVTL